MVSNVVLEGILDVINKATPKECKIMHHYLIHPKTSNNLGVTIYNYREEYLSIRIYKEENNKFLLGIESDAGISIIVEIEELDFLNIQTAILMCKNRYNSTISEFCNNFYN